MALARSIRRHALLAAVILLAAALLAAVVLSACASDQTAEQVRTAGASIVAVERARDHAADRAAAATTDAERDHWRERAATLAAELAAQRAAAEALAAQHDEADAADQSSWTTSMTTVGTLAAAIPGASAITGILALMRGRRSGASILAAAIAKARAADAVFDARFTDDASPAVVALHANTPRDLVPVIERANDAHHPNRRRKRATGGTRETGAAA